MVKIISVEGVAGAGKTEFCQRLFECLKETEPYCVIKQPIGHQMTRSLMNFILLSDAHQYLSFDTIMITDLLLFIQREITNNNFKEGVVIIEQYIPSLYARMKCSYQKTAMLNIFNAYRADTTFFLDIDVEQAFITCNKLRSITYWDTDYQMGLSPRQVRKDLIAFYRGKYSIEQIHDSFVRFYRQYASALLEYLDNKPYISIPSSLRLEDKISFALDKLNAL